MVPGCVWPPARPNQANRFLLEFPSRPSLLRPGAPLASLAPLHFSGAGPYGIDASPDLISAVTDAVLEEIAAWQARPLEPVYPLVFFDALRVKIRDEGLVRNNAIRAVFAEATVQTCIVHLLRHSLDFVSDKDRKAVATALKDIYSAVDAAAGETALAVFDAGLWGRKYQAMGQSWRPAWGEVVPFYAFPPDVRRILYTTNAIEALNAKRRRVVRTRGHFPTDEAAMKLLDLVLNRSEKEWIIPAHEWVHGQGSVRHPVRRALHQGIGLIMCNRPPTHEIPDSPIGHGRPARQPQPIETSPP